MHMLSSSRTFKQSTKPPKYQVYSNLPKHVTEIICALYKPLPLQRFYLQKSFKENFLGNVPHYIKIFGHEVTRAIRCSEIESHLIIRKNVKKFVKFTKSQC